MRLAVIILSVLFSFAFAQNSVVSLEACDTEQVISQNVLDNKAELEFTSSKSIAKCFYSINTQMKAEGWKIALNTNNVFSNNLFRIIYSQNGVKQMLIVRKTDNVYKVLLNGSKTMSASLQQPSGNQLIATRSRNTSVQ